MSKRRSGLAFHKRAYNRCCRRPICTEFTLINIQDIATLNNGNTWFLNKDTSILTCQLLIIPLGIELQTNAFTLTNYGTINLFGTLRNGPTIPNLGEPYITINNGTINISSTGKLEAVDATNKIINNGIVNNKGLIIAQSNGICINNSSGRIINTNGGEIRNNESTINNFGIIDNNTGCLISNQNQGTFTNNVNAIINNTGGTINNLLINSSFINDGIIFNNNGGTIDNTVNTGNIFTNNGTIQNSLIGSLCGVGTLLNVTGGTIGNLCS